MALTLPADTLVRGPYLGDLTMQFWCDASVADKRSRWGIGVVVQEDDQYVCHHSDGSVGTVTSEEAELAAVAAAMMLIEYLSTEERARSVVLTDNSPPGTRPRAHWMAHYLSRWRAGICAEPKPSMFFPELDKRQKRA